MIKLIALLFSMNTTQNPDKVYEYINYYNSGEIFKIVFDIEKGKLYSGDTIFDKSYVDCSNEKLRCLKFGETTIFAPVKIVASGEFESPYGKYIVYNNKGALPFNKEIKYSVIEYLNDKEKSLTIFYNENKGVVALIDPSNIDVSKFNWLYSDCGLLSSKDCIRD